MKKEKDEDLLCKRLMELANVTFQKGICTYTDFLNLNEINLFFNIKSKMPPVDTMLFGGYNDAERKVLCFYEENSYIKLKYPIDCIHIKPKSAKFSEHLNHRDFLGALIHLGINRSKLGDIIIEENQGYLFCNSKISQFIVDNLSIIKHTNVTCEVIDFMDIDYTPRYITMTGTVPSIRLDAILSVAFKTSRNSLSGSIHSGKVYVNSKLVLSSSYVLKEGDIVSYKGYGKFLFKKINKQTKKGRIFITLLKYT